MRSLHFLLENTEDTLELGRLFGLAFACADRAIPSALYLSGGLGGGKTTFARGFVQALPGGERAEVASPSFTLCHQYPTTPRVLHMDLYRLGQDSLFPEEVEEMLEDGVPSVLLVEWPERLNPALVTPERLDVSFAPYPASEIPQGLSSPPQLDILTQPCKKKRLASVTAHGEAASRLLEETVTASRFRFVKPPS